MPNPTPAPVQPVGTRRALSGGMETYRIECNVSGGVTGHRTAWLKRDDKVREFRTREEAQTVATNLNNEMNRGNAGAYYRYTVVGGNWS